MPRFLIILMLVLVPLQMTYAAAAGYCSHDEQGMSASHFGHHAHKHVQPDGGKKPPKGIQDLDCGLCQLACAHVTFAVIPQLDLAALSPHASPSIDRLRSIALPEHLRPPLAASVA